MKYFSKPAMQLRAPVWQLEAGRFSTVNAYFWCYCQLLHLIYCISFVLKQIKLKFRFEFRSSQLVKWSIHHYSAYEIHFKSTVSLLNSSVSDRLLTTVISHLPLLTVDPVFNPASRNMKSLRRGLMSHVSAKQSTVLVEKITDFTMLYDYNFNQKLDFILFLSKY